MSAAQDFIPVATDDIEPGYYRVADELVRVFRETYAVRDADGDITARYRFAARGLNGTTAASHAQGTAVTLYVDTFSESPDPFSAGGAEQTGWTYDEFGNVVIAPSETPDAGAGNVKIVAPSDSSDAFTVTDSSNPGSFNFGIDPFGYILGTGADFGGDNSAGGTTTLKVTGTGGFFDLLQVSDDDGVLLRVTGNGEFLLKNYDTNTGFQTTRDGQVIVRPDTSLSATEAAFRVLDSNGIAVFEVRKNGSVHIKTGTSIVADL